MEGSECIVVDAGSASVKAGYAGEDTPRAVFPSHVPDEPPTGRKPEAMECYSDANRHEYPIQRGLIVDDGWDKMERLLEATFAEELRSSPEGGFSVMLAEAPGTSASAREKLAQILFETFKAPAVCFFNSAALSLFASGRTRGIVLECGAGVSHAVPVFEGFALAHAVRRREAAGADVTAALKQEVDLPWDVLRDLKERLCKVKQRSSLVDFTTDATEEDDDNFEYELPDGTMIKVPPRSQCAPAEVLFEPGNTDDHPPLPDLVVQSIGMCDRDLQADLKASVVLAGGTTMLPGFCSRVKDDLVNAYPEESIRVVPGPNPTGTSCERGYNSQRKHAAWIGGSMFASLDTFKDVRVAKQEWEDDEHIIHRKAF